MPDDERPSDVYDEIDENLRRAYSALLNEELPDRFRALIQQLKDESGEIPAVPSESGEGE